MYAWEQNASVGWNSSATAIICPLNLLNELNEMILSAAYGHLIGKAREGGVRAAYLIRGGLKSQQLQRCKELSGEFYMFSTFNSSREDGICLYAEQEGFEQLSMNIDRLRLLTEAGSRLNCRWFNIIQIDSP